jgi:hypothetical protein
MESLSSQSVVDALNGHFLFWVGRMDSSIEALLKNFLGNPKYPLLAVVGNLGSGMTIMDLIQGPLPADALLVRLLHICEEHEPTFQRLKREQDARRIERQLVEEQDSAYNQSLSEDMEKARIRKMEQDKIEKEEQEKRAAIEVQ